MMRKPNPIHNLFKESFLVFQQQAEGSEIWQLANPQPAARNAGIINPQTDVNEFMANEQTSTEAAMQTPVKNLAIGTYDAVKEAVKEVASLPQKTLNIGTTAIGNTVSMATRLAGSAIKLPLSVAALAITTPIALAANVTTHAIDVGIKIPSSMINIAGSKVKGIPTKISAIARSAQEKASGAASKLAGNIGDVGDMIRNNVTALKLPIVGDIKPGYHNGMQTSSGDSEDENQMPSAG